MRREQAAAVGWVALVALVITAPVTAPLVAFLAGRWTA